MDTQQTIILGEFIYGLSEASDIEACFQQLNKAVEQLGFLGVVYTSIPIGLKLIDEKKPIFLCSSGFSPQFLKHYEEANFAQDDFTIKKILSGNIEPIAWWQEESKGILLDAEKQVIQVARDDYGVTNGISLPTQSDSHYIAGASIISEDKDPQFNVLVKERLKILRLVIQYFHAHIDLNPECKKSFYQPLLAHLTEQEKQVIKHATTGELLKEVEGKYHISSSRAGNVRSALIKKFGIKKFNQLVYIVGLHRLLDML